MTQIRNRNTCRSVCLHQLQSVNGIESVNTPLEGTIQHFTIGSLTVQACPCFYCFLFQHHTFCTEPQTTVNQRHNLTLYFDFYCALSFFSRFTCRAGARSWNIYKITRGVTVSFFRPQFHHLTFFHTIFLSRQDLPSMVVLPV